MSQIKLKTIVVKRINEIEMAFFTIHSIQQCILPQIVRTKIQNRMRTTGNHAMLFPTSLCSHFL